MRKNQSKRRGKNAERERDEYADNLRGVLIISVVLAHFTKYLTYWPAPALAVHFWVGLFAMPAFIFIMGYFSVSTAGSLEKTLRRTVEFFGYYTAMKLLRYGERLIIGKREPFFLLYERAVPWYCLFVCWSTLMLFFLHKIRQRAESSVGKKAAAVITMAAVSAAGVLSGYAPIKPDFLVTARTFTFFPFFYAGYLAKENGMKLEQPGKYIHPLLAAGLMAAVFCLVCMNAKAFHKYSDIILGHVLAAQFKVPDPVRPYARCIHYAVSAIMTLLLFNAVPADAHGIWKLVSKTGRNSLSIYFYHRVIIHFLADIGAVKWCTAQGVAGFCLWMLTAVLMTLVLQADIFMAPLKGWRRIVQATLRTGVQGGKQCIS